MYPSFHDPTMLHHRRTLYDFGSYNPYLHTAAELALVEENLKRLQSGEISISQFLRQTPCFPRWEERHIHQAKVLLVSNEPGLNDADRLYGDLIAAKPEEVAGFFKAAMLSWLSLSDHPGLGCINGEAPWRQDGPWQTEHPRLARCGKAGYFLALGEENVLSRCKVLHVCLSPFAQAGSQDVNPRNDQDGEYHQENLQMVGQFCRQSSPTKPRYIFIVGHRARIRCVEADFYQLESVRTSRKDRSLQIVDLLRDAQVGVGIQVRLCRKPLAQGSDGEVLELVRATAFELRPA